MLVLIGIVLAIVPAAFILWPFVVGLRRDEFDYDEGAPQADLMRRWDAAVSGLANAELDHGLGNMTRQRLLHGKGAVDVRSGLSHA